MLQTLITDTVGPVPIYKNRPAPIQLQWTGCGSESVLRSVLTLMFVVCQSQIKPQWNACCQQMESCHDPSSQYHCLSLTQLPHHCCCCCGGRDSSLVSSRHVRDQLCRQVSDVTSLTSIINTTFIIIKRTSCMTINVMNITDFRSQQMQKSGRLLSIKIQSNLVILPHSVQSIFLARGEVGEITRHSSMGRGVSLSPSPAPPP